MTDDTEAQRDLPATRITRGDPPDLTNVRRNVYHHYIPVR